jgi:hypothetical protein
MSRLLRATGGDQSTVETGLEQAAHGYSALLDAVAEIR